jgi:hypothetical protein
VGEHGSAVADGKQGYGNVRAPIDKENQQNRVGSLTDKNFVAILPDSPGGPKNVLCEGPIRGQKCARTQL